MTEQISIRLRRAVLAILAGGIVTASAVQANPSSNIVVVAPTALPELARQPGEAILLRETIDGRAILHVEQVRETMSKDDTGTTFLLAKEGLFVIRRPAVESEKRQRDEAWLLEHAGS